MHAATWTVHILEWPENWLHIRVLDLSKLLVYTFFIFNAINFLSHCLAL
jgi:hypothetical protein